MANYRNEKLRRAVDTLPCQICGKHGTQASHSNQLRDGKGLGIKAPDYRIAALCPECHADIDQGKDLTKAERHDKWNEAHRRTMGALFENGLVGVL